VLRKNEKILQGRTSSKSQINSKFGYRNFSNWAPWHL